jgi:hypothetical protein
MQRKSHIFWELLGDYGWVIIINDDDPQLVINMSDVEDNNNGFE